MFKDLKDVISQDDRREKANKLLKHRDTWWFAETYLQENEFQYALSKASHWAYIFHDQDDNVPHYHVLLHYENARSGSAVLKDFVGYQNTFVKRCEHGAVVCYEYLTHKNDPDKYQYNADRIISHNPVYWSHFIPDIRDRTDTDFIEDLLNSEKLDYYKMAKKYGRDFMKNWRNYVDFRDEVLFQRRINNAE